MIILFLYSVHIPLDVIYEMVHVRVMSRFEVLFILSWDNQAETPTCDVAVEYWIDQFPSRPFQSASSNIHPLSQTFSINS